MNKVLLIGNLTADPKVKKVGNDGVSYCSFRVAVNRRFKNSAGERETDFISVCCWRGLADVCAQYLAKGRKVGVEGSLQTRTYEKDGEKRYVCEVVADNVDFLTSTQSASKAAPETDNGGFVETDDELPFA